jgi:heme/copper-type cytochrome/quinol oxidase subunit 3
MAVMGNVLRYPSPRVREDTTAWLGMVIFLASWAMLFAALFFAYGFIRTRSESWPPSDVPLLPVSWPAANTLVLALSSAAVQRGLRAIQRGETRASTRSVVGAALLGVIFLLSQLLLWSALYRLGLKPSTGGPYASVFYGLTWFHALHVLVGVFGLAWVASQLWRGWLSPARHLPLKLWTMYWHFVGVIWGLLFISVFLI